MQIELNPFASKFTSPQSCDFVEDKFSKHHLEVLLFGMNLSRCVQIIGPHGSGKTTLAVYVANKLADRFHEARIITIRRSEQRKFGTLSVSTEYLFRNQPLRADSRLAIIDGLEQLAGLQRWLLVQAFLENKIGLIVTCHKPLSFIRYRSTLQPRKEQFNAIALSLLENSGVELCDDDIASVFNRCNGNYRTGLSMLYDRYVELSRQESRKLAS